MQAKLKPMMLILAIGLFQFASAQVTSTFMRTFKAPNMNGGLGMDVTSDGGFIGTGQHESTGAGSCDLYVYKVNSCGDPQWFKTYGSAAEDGGKTIKQTPDGGYIVVGLTHFGAGGAYDLWLMKLDALGNVTWSRTYGGGGDDYGLNVNPTSDGGYIITGFTNGLGWGGADIVVIKTDATGNQQWYKIYGGAADDWGDFIEQTSDGGYILTGYTASYGAGSADVIMMKLDASGNIQWSKTYGTAADDSPAWGNLARITPDGGYIICSHTSGAGAGNYDFWVFKTDASGNVQWSNTYGGAGEESSRYIEPTPDNGYIVCGYTNSFGAGGYDAYVIKIDATGNHLWSKVYGGTGTDRATVVKNTADGGFSMSLLTTSFGADYFDPIFMKTDSAGNVGCNESTPATIVGSFIPTVGTTIPNTQIPALSFSMPVFTPGTYTPVDDYLCFICSSKPKFVASDTLVCIGEPVKFFNTSDVGARCHENWQVNGSSISGIDTIVYTFPTAGIFTVSLLGQCGPNSDTLSASVFVLDAPVADFTFVNQCQDTVISFADQSTWSVLTTIKKQIWDYGDGTSDTLVSHPTHHYAVAGNYNVSLTVIDREDCTNTIVKQVTAYPLPVAGFSFTDVCNTHAVNFADTSTVATGAIASRQWNFGDGTSAATQAASRTYVAPGQYQVMLKVTSDQGCVDSITQPVNIFDVPVAAFSVSSACFGTSTQFNNTSTISAGTITTNSWDFGDANTSQQLYPSNLYAAANTYTVHLVTTSNNGCPDSVSHPVTIYPIPVAGFTYGDTCQGMVVAFIDTSSVSSGTIASWAWSFGDAGTANTGSATHTYAQPSTYSVKLTVTSNNNCVDSVTHTATAYPNPVSAFNFSDVCFNYPNSFTNNSNVASGSIVTSAWTFDDGNISAQTSPSATYTAPGTYNVQLLSTTDHGCKDSISHSVVVYPDPVAGFTFTAPCVGTAMQFTDSTTPTGLASLYNWDFGDAATSASQNPGHLYAAAGNYNVQLISTTSNGCTDTISKQVTVLGKGAAAFSAPNVCLNDSMPFTNATNAGTYALSNYWWDLGDAAGTGTDVNPTYKYNNTGSYRVLLIANFSNGCADSTTQTVTVYELPTVNKAITNVSCYLGSDASFKLTPVNGLAPFTYVWNNGATTQNAVSLPTGPYSVTFSDAHQCTATASDSITQPPLLVADTTVNLIVCYGNDNGSIEVVVSGGTRPYIYNWSNGKHTSTISNLAPGTYAVTITDSLGCTTSQSVTLDQTPLYQLELDSVITINLGENIVLNPTPVNGTAVNWDWSPATFLTCTDCQSPTAQPFTTFAYRVQSTSDKGCQTEKSVLVTVIPSYDVFIPNAFTPNGDGNDDYFEVYGRKDTWKQFFIQIYDRIGEKVFESSDIDFKWDGKYRGKDLNTGSYVYTMRVVYIDNHSDKMYKGTILLLK